MQKFFTGTWWVLLVRGILAILFGIFALNNTAATVIVLFWIFILYAVADGVFTIFMAILHRHDSDRGPDDNSGSNPFCPAIAGIWAEHQISSERCGRGSAVSTRSLAAYHGGGLGDSLLCPACFGPGI